jgi:hypothetical protein
VFKLLDLVKNLEIWTFFREKGEYLKKYLYDPHSISSNPWLSKRLCPKVLKICQITKFDMGFQKTTREVDWRKSIFNLRRKLGEVSLKNQI